MLPSKQPAYRQNRSHADFLTRLALPVRSLREALREAWGARDALLEIPRSKIARMAEEKYTKDEWNLKW